MFGNRYTFLALGICIGTAAGLLWAPKAGKHTRRMIVRTSDHARDTAADLFDRGKASVEQMRDAIVHAVA